MLISQIAWYLMISPMLRNKTRLYCTFTVILPRGKLVVPTCQIQVYWHVSQSQPLPSDGNIHIYERTRVECSLQPDSQVHLSHIESFGFNPTIFDYKNISLWVFLTRLNPWQALATYFHFPPFSSTYSFKHRRGPPRANEGSLTCFRISAGRHILWSRV